MVVERRTSERHEIALGVACRAEGAAIAGRCVDVSRGGAFVQCAALLPEGEQVRVAVELAELETCELLAEVIRTADGTSGQPRGIGLRFVLRDLRDQVALDSLLRASSPSSAPPPMAIAVDNLVRLREVPEARVSMPARIYGGSTRDGRVG